MQGSVWCGAHHYCTSTALLPHHHTVSIPFPSPSCQAHPHFTHTRTHTHTHRVTVSVFVSPCMIWCFSLPLLSNHLSNSFLYSCLESFHDRAVMSSSKFLILRMHKSIKSGTALLYTCFIPKHCHNRDEDKMAINTPIANDKTRCRIYFNHACLQACSQLYEVILNHNSALS